MLIQLYARVAFLLTCGKHFHLTALFLLRGAFGAIRTSLTPSLHIYVPVPSQKNERSCICVLGVSVMYLCVRGICHVFVC